MERLLHYVWQHRLYAPTTLSTVNGLEVEVLDPGTQNTHAGPDFFNAKIKMDGIVWAGNVEIHSKASDWLHHRHDTDKAYDSVVLHVVGENDCEIRQTNGSPLTQLVLPVPQAVKDNIEWLLFRDASVPCLHRLREVESVYLRSCIDYMMVDRLERKTADITTLLEQYDKDWNEVFYITLTRNFGFGVNSDAFERLAKSLPFRCLQKQRYSHSFVEAMLFGQAGMLEEESDDTYYRFLQQEYRFLRKKFELVPLETSLFKNMRVRPDNSPQQRLAQLAAIWVANDTVFSRILEAVTPGQIKSCFRVPPSIYWQTHYNFRHISPKKEGGIGDDALNNLLINTVVPMLFVYGRQHDRQDYCDRAVALLERLPPEKNAIVSMFRQAGMEALSAADTQALIQLKRAYCETKKCLYCRIGFRLLTKSIYPAKPLIRPEKP
jgi:hypothetical protein